MYGIETAMFVDALRSDDRSILDLLDSDYTFVNEDLAGSMGCPRCRARSCAGSRSSRRTTAAGCWGWAVS